MLLAWSLTEVKDDQELLRACACVMGAACSVNAMSIAYSRIRNRHYLTRHVLSADEDSAWRKLCDSKDDMAYLELTGLTYISFKRLYKEFAPLLIRMWSVRKKRRGETRGRKRVMKPWDVLALTLAYMHLVSGGTSLRLIFAKTPATLSRYLADGLCALLTVLQHCKEGLILWPNEQEMKEWAALVQRRQPKLQGCFGFVDGLNLRIEEPADPKEQNAYYNSWLGENATCHSVCLFVCFMGCSCVPTYMP